MSNDKPKNSRINLIGQELKSAFKEFETIERVSVRDEEQTIELKKRVLVIEVLKKQIKSLS